MSASDDAAMVALDLLLERGPEGFRITELDAAMERAGLATSPIGTRARGNFALRSLRQTFGRDVVINVGNRYLEARTLLEGRGWLLKLVHDLARRSGNVRGYTDQWARHNGLTESAVVRLALLSLTRSQEDLEGLARLILDLQNGERGEDVGQLVTRDRGSLIRRADEATLQRYVMRPRWESDGDYCTGVEYVEDVARWEPHASNSWRARPPDRSDDGTTSA